MRELLRRTLADELMVVLLDHDSREVVYTVGASLVDMPPLCLHAVFISTLFPRVIAGHQHQHQRQVKHQHHPHPPLHTAASDFLD